MSDAEVIKRNLIELAASKNKKGKKGSKIVFNALSDVSEDESQPPKKVSRRRKNDPSDDEEDEEVKPKSKKPSQRSKRQRLSGDTVEDEEDESEAPPAKEDSEDEDSEDGEDAPAVVVARAPPGKKPKSREISAEEKARMKKREKKSKSDQRKENEELKLASDAITSATASTAISLREENKKGTTARAKLARSSDQGSAFLFHKGNEKDFYEACSPQHNKKKDSIDTMKAFHEAEPEDDDDLDKLISDTLSSLHATFTIGSNKAKHLQALITFTSGTPGPKEKRAAGDKTPKASKQDEGKKVYTLGTRIQNIVHEVRLKGLKEEETSARIELLRKCYLKGLEDTGRTFRKAISKFSPVRDVPNGWEVPYDLVYPISEKFQQKILKAAIEKNKLATEKFTEENQRKLLVIQKAEDEGEDEGSEQPQQEAQAPKTSKSNKRARQDEDEEVAEDKEEGQRLKKKPVPSIADDF